MSFHDHLSDTPRDEDDPDVAFDQFTSKSLPELKVDIQDTLELLISSSEIAQPPSEEEYELIFEPDAMPVAIALPKGLLANISPESTITDIHIYGDASAAKLIADLRLLFAVKAFDSTTSVIQCGIDDDTVQVFFCPISSESSLDDALPLSEDDPSFPGFSFPTTELKRMFGSIIAPNKTGDYSIFDKLDLGDYETIVNILQALSSRASATVYQATTHLQPLTQTDPSTITYTRHDGQLQAAEIQRYHETGALTRYGISFLPPELYEDGSELYLDAGFDKAYCPNDATPTYEKDSEEVLNEIIDYLRQITSAVPRYSVELMSGTLLEEIGGGHSDTYNL